MEENPWWKIILWWLDREISWPSNRPILVAVATIAKRWSNGGWENNNIRASEMDGRQTNIGSGESDERKGYTLDETRENGPITRLHPFAWDVQRWWHDISDISPWIHSISVDRKSMRIQSPRIRASVSYTDYLGYFRIFSPCISRFTGNWLARRKGGRNPSSYRPWNRLELAWFNFAFELRDLFVPFLDFKTLGSDTRIERREASIRSGGMMMMSRI